MDQLEERKKTNLKIKWFQVVIIRFNATIIKFNTSTKVLLLDLILLLNVRHSRIKKKENYFYIFQVVIENT